MINSPTPLTYLPVGTAGLTSEKISLRLAANKTIIFLSSGHMLAAPRVELLVTILAAGALEHALRCSGRREAPNVAQMLLQAALGEEPPAVGALRVLGRCYSCHL